MQWQARTVADRDRPYGGPLCPWRLPFEIERLVQAMYRNEYARGGPVLNSAIAAIEFALWDICGKALGQPVFNLLGGQGPQTIPAYANGWYDPEAGRTTSPPPRATLSMPLSGPEFDPFWGLARDPGLADLRRGIEAVAAVRAAVGPDIKIIVDGHGRFSVGTSSPAYALAENGVDWFEEPVDPENYMALGQVARPRAFGSPSASALLALPDSQLSPQLGRPHVLQPDPIQVGGLLEARRSRVSPTQAICRCLPSPVGPIASAAILQLYAATTNIFRQESFSDSTRIGAEDLITNCPMPVDGSYWSTHCRDWRHRTDESAVRDHPYPGRAVQSMWAVNGSMLSPRGEVVGEGPTPSAGNEFDLRELRKRKNHADGNAQEA